MELKAAIQKLVDTNVFNEELNNQEYFFQKLKDLYDLFIAYDVSPILNKLENEILPFLEHRGNGFKTEQFLAKYENEPVLFNFLLLIVRMDTYIDEKAYNKKILNEYPDKRILARPLTPMPVAIKLFIWLKISPEKLATDHIFIRCLNYLQHPDKHTIIMSENHRKAVAYSLWGGNNGDAFFDTLRDWFNENIQYKTVNALNQPVFWGRALYHDVIKPLWFKSTDELPTAVGNGEESAIGEKLANNRLINMASGSGNTITTIDFQFPALNTILYGPPGTGKTFNSVEKAVEIADYSFYKDNKDNRDALTKRFRELLINMDSETPSGQIAFCTFHQSMSYEDFVEGIKSSVIKDDENTSHIKYEVKDGILKILARMATDAVHYNEVKQKDNITLSDETIDRSAFYKMSLGNTQLEDDDDIFRYCMENNCIAMGWGEDIDYTNMNTADIVKATVDSKQKGTAAQQINMFIHQIKIQDYVIISNGNHRFRAIGKVTGDYEYREEAPIDFYHFRPVVWLFKDFDLPVHDVYEKNFQQWTLYRLKGHLIKKDFFNKKSDNQQSGPKEIPKFVLIIDEINRGDVSKIFGELITLIEDDKRSGRTNELSTILPYSKRKFTLPPNLYIIGTMNTADRSVEALDTALRRRFSFKELAPDITQIQKSPEGIDLPALLTAINQRIEILLDKDHTIGHAWLMGITTMTQLKIAFRDKVLPLFQEYFYNDYAKIGLILGEACINETKVSASQFPKNSNKYDLLEDYDGKVIYKLKDPMLLTKENFQSIYQ
jgi:hypothetical protein